MNRQYEKEYKIKGVDLLVHFNADIETKIQCDDFDYTFGDYEGTHVESNRVIDSCEILLIMVFRERYNEWVEPSERLYQALSAMFMADDSVDLEISEGG